MLAWMPWRAGNTYEELEANTVSGCTSRGNLLPPGLASRGWWRYLAGALLVVGGFTFTPAVTCSVYSIAREKFKILGAIGLVIAVLTVWLERETLYFAETGIALVPGTLLVMLVIAKLRAKAGGTSPWW
jgi:hypothetical protein